MKTYIQFNENKNKVNTYYNMYNDNPDDIIENELEDLTSDILSLERYKIDYVIFYFNKNFNYFRIYAFTNYELDSTIPNFMISKNETKEGIIETRLRIGNRIIKKDDIELLIQSSKFNI